MTSFVTDALNEQRTARETTQRLESQAKAAWAREEAKIASANARERAKQDRQAAREREIAAGRAEAEAVTRALQARLTELETLLVSTLDRDPHVPFDQLKEPLILPEFRPPKQLAVAAAAPEESDFMPEPLSGLGALAPGRKRAYAAAVTQGQAEYERAAAAHAQTEQRRREQLAQARAEYETALIRERERIERQHAVVDQLASDFAAGRRKVVKRFAPHRKVEIAAVREIVGSISQREFNKGIIITTSGFTSAAREEATRLGVELYGGERLLWLLRQHLHREYNVIDHERRKPPIKNPPA